MTTDKKFKAAVRGRMAETGENYMRARRVLLNEENHVKTPQQDVNDALNKLHAKHEKERVEFLRRVAEWLDQATYHGACDRLAAPIEEGGTQRCFTLAREAQPNATWAELDSTKFCDSCAAHWHASNAAALLEKVRAGRTTVPGFKK